MSGWNAGAAHLLETLTDSMAGYDHVGEHAHRFGFYAFCEHHATERAQLLHSYRRLMERRAGQAERHGSILGTAHRLFLDFRAALSSGDLAVIEELIRGESFLASRIDRLLEQDDTPQDIASLGRKLRAHVSQSLLDLQAMQDHARQGQNAKAFRPFS